VWGLPWWLELIGFLRDQYLATKKGMGEERVSPNEGEPAFPNKTINNLIMT